MNIPAINKFNLLPVLQPKQKNSNANYSSTFGLKMAQPLRQDTVSFSATIAPPHTLTHYGNGISLKTAKQIHQRAEIAQKKISRLFNEWFNNMLATDKNPDGIIEYYTGRAKSPESIVEKTASPRKWNEDDTEPWCLRTIEEINKYVNDLNGVKIVLRDVRRDSIKKILCRLAELVRQHELSIISIKNKVPSSDSKKLAYATEEYLNQYVKKLSPYQKRIISLKPYEKTKTNYTALHVLISVPVEIDGETVFRTVEVQIMGHDVAVAKPLFDLTYKLFDNKAIPKKYAPIKELLEPLRLPEKLLKMNKQEIESLSDEYLIELRRPDLTRISRDELYKRVDTRNKFDTYCADVLKSQREKEPQKYSDRVGADMEYFEPATNLPKIYDINNLYRLMLKCEHKI